MCQVWFNDSSCNKLFCFPTVGQRLTDTDRNTLIIKCLFLCVSLCLYFLHKKDKLGQIFLTIRNFILSMSSFSKDAHSRWDCDLYQSMWSFDSLSPKKKHFLLQLLTHLCLTNTLNWHSCKGVFTCIYFLCVFTRAYNLQINNYLADSVMFVPYSCLYA